MTVAMPPAEMARRGLRGHIDDAIDGVVDYRSIVPLRIAAGPLLLGHLAPALADSLDGRTYRDVFHIPVTGWYPELPDPLFVVALWAAAASAVLLSCGLFTRQASIGAAGFMTYHLFLTETHYHHNRAFLAVLLVFLALVPAGERVSLDARLGRVKSPEPGFGVRWPLTLVRFQVGAVYAASGISKLVDGDWFGGTVLYLRVAAQAEAAVAGGVPVAIVDLASSAGFHLWFAKLVVLTEILIGVGLWFGRTRWVAVWLAVAFHLAIELTADVELFSYAALVALVIWVVPRSKDRALDAPNPWARIAALLDWTGRLSITTGPWRLIDRNGQVAVGWDAALRSAVLLPATFLVAAPLWALRGVRSHDPG
ncbi:MAG TPA: HTTM domain-containing protein [Acidimicrobiia bacterium]|jgi:uncharacterized membrane protein YphA (DoxX/SURF4 family)|nr:HTTM domain-containing protein [Acidimicrobiia bacterium]